MLDTMPSKVTTTAKCYATFFCQFYSKSHMIVKGITPGELAEWYANLDTGGYGFAEGFGEANQNMRSLDKMLNGYLEGLVNRVLSLIKVELSGINLSERDLTVIATLQWLEVLKLKMPSHGKVWEVVEGGFL
nr:putative late blight resistance protein homolog R1A-4 isoform X1 [Ipomoea batatas]